MIKRKNKWSFMKNIKILVFMVLQDSADNKLTTSLIGQEVATRILTHIPQAYFFLFLHTSLHHIHQHLSHQGHAIVSTK